MTYPVDVTVIDMPKYIQSTIIHTTGKIQAEENGRDGTKNLLRYK